MKKEESKKKAPPEILNIWVEVNRWTETANDEAFRKGVVEGHKDAGEMIFHALRETPVDRVRRLCVEKLGVEQEDPPF